MRRHSARDKVVRLGGRKVVAKGLSTGLWIDPYHTAMRVSWGVFIGSAGVIFAGFNAVFATLYAIFPGSVANVPPDQPWHVLFFSIETLSTVGYGDMHPQSEWGHWVASCESFAGVIFSAVLTGMIFARFSRPRARLLFSKRAIIGQFEGHRYLMIRVANARANMISDAVAKVWMLADIISVEGTRFRRFFELKLDRVQNPSFVLSWTLFHRIDAESPLYGWDIQRMEEAEMALTVTMRGSDESVAQDLRARYSYLWKDIAFDHRFVDLLANDEKGYVVLDYGLFHEIEPEEPLELEEVVEPEELVEPADA